MTEAANTPSISEDDQVPKPFSTKRRQVRINKANKWEPFSTVEDSSMIKGMLEIQLKTKSKFTANIKDESQKSWFNDNTTGVTARDSLTLLKNLWLGVWEPIILVKITSGKPRCKPFIANYFFSVPSVL